MTGEGGSEIAVILLDEHGTIVDAHASCIETFGWQRTELLGQDVRELLQYGRELLMSQLQVLEDDGEGHTSFSVRVLAKRKDQQQFPARATVRRFRELECWTVAFYRAESEPYDSQVTPSVSPEEIALAKRALEEGTASLASKTKKQKPEVQKGQNMSVSRLWRNSRLLFSSREDKTPEMAGDSLEEQAVEETIARDSAAMAAQIVQRAPAEAETTAAAAPGINPEPRTAPPAPPVPAPVPTATMMPPPQPAPAQASRPEVQSLPSDNVPGMARLKAELEKERGERARIEQRCATLSAQVQALHLQLSESLNLERENSARGADLERDLRESREALIQSKSELDAEKRELESAEEHLALLKDLNQRIEQNMASLDTRVKNCEANEQALRDQLSEMQENQRQLEAALEKERGERQQIEQAHAAMVRDQRAAEQKSTSDLSLVRSQLEAAEIEKGRAREQMLRYRAESLEAARCSRAQVNGFRKEFARILEHITGTTRELLQSSLSDEQKCVIEALLQDVIALEGILGSAKVASEELIAA